MMKNLLCEILLVVIIVAVILWLYAPLILLPGIPTGGDEIYYAWASEIAKRTKLEFHTPWIGGPTEYYFYLWYDLLVINSFSKLFKEKFPIAIIIFFSTVATLSFFKTALCIVEKLKLKTSFLTKLTVLFMSILFISTGGIYSNGFNPYLIGLGNSVGFLVTIVPVTWTFIALSALKTSKLGRKVFYYLLLHLFSLLALYNPAGYILVMFLYILWLLSIIFSKVTINNFNFSNTHLLRIDILILLINMFLYTLYAVLPSYIARKLGALSHLEFYFNPEELTWRIDLFSNKPLQLFILYTREDKTLLGTLSSVSLFPFSYILVILCGISLITRKYLVMARELYIRTFLYYIIFSLIFGVFISTGGLFPSILSRLYFSLFLLLGGILSKPAKFAGIFFFPYMLLCTLGIAMIIKGLKFRLKYNIVKLFLFIVIFGIIFILLTATFYGLIIRLNEWTYKLYSPLKVPNDLFIINRLFKNESEVRALVVPTCFEWLWKPLGKPSGYIAQYPYEVLWNLRYPVFPFHWLEWRTIIKESNLSMTLPALLKTFNIDFIVISKELIKNTNPESNYKLWIYTSNRIRQIMHINGVLRYEGKDYEVYYFRTQYAYPAILRYYERDDHTEAKCRKHYKMLLDIYEFYYNNTHIISPDMHININNTLKREDIDMVKIKSIKLLFAGSIAFINIEVPKNFTGKILALHVGDVYNRGFINIGFYSLHSFCIPSIPTLSNATVLLIPIKHSDMLIVRAYIPSLIWLITFLLNVFYVSFLFSLFFKYSIIQYVKIKTGNNN